MHGYIQIVRGEFECLMFYDLHLNANWMNANYLYAARGEFFLCSHLNQ